MERLIGRPSVEQALDRLEIQDVLAAYSEAIDTRDWDALDWVFTADAVIDYTEMGGIRGTLPEIKQFLAAALGPSGRFVRTQHMLGQSHIVLDGDTARARTACFNPMIFGEFTVTEDERLHFVGLWYRDVLVRTVEGWRIRERFEERTYKFKPYPSS